MNLSAPIYELKRQAKLLRREAGIPLNQALTRIANQEGYVNWGLLIKDHESKKLKPTAIPKAGYLITAFPVDAEYREEAIALANATFKKVMRRIEPNHPEKTRSLWDAEKYIDDHHLSADMLPIDSEYALSLIEAFLVHYVIKLAVQADDMVRDGG
jgi:hypothetical protein